MQKRLRIGVLYSRVRVEEKWIFAAMEKRGLDYERLDDRVISFDLENPNDLARLEQPMTALSGLIGTVVIDEVQRRPELFPVLRVLADRTPRKARFLILGSAAPALLRQSSETPPDAPDCLSLV
jgi:predicted AAA+ superfamily ATPase